MAGGCSFEDTHTENLGFCPNEDLVGGVMANAAYIPMAQLGTFTKPVITPTSTYEERVTIAPTGIVPVVGKGFKAIDFLVDENELKNGLVGNKGNLKAQGSIDAMIPNFTARNLGFIDAHKNTPLMLIITDSEGTKWVLPNAYVTKADSTTGKSYTEGSGTAVTIICNSKIYKYSGDIDLTPDVVVP